MWNQLSYPICYCGPGKLSTRLRPCRIYHCSPFMTIQIPHHPLLLRPPMTLPSPHPVCCCCGHGRLQIRLMPCSTRRSYFLRIPLLPPRYLTWMSSWIHQLRLLIPPRYHLHPLLPHRCSIDERLPIRRSLHFSHRPVKGNRQLLVYLYTLCPFSVLGKLQIL
jgi:hypothetical protein